VFSKADFSKFDFKDILVLKCQVKIHLALLEEIANFVEEISLETIEITKFIRKLFSEKYVCQHRCP